MATVSGLLPSQIDFYAELKTHSDEAERIFRTKATAALNIQRYTRGYLIRKYLKYLSKNACTIQRAFRMHRARKIRLQYLRVKGNKKFNKEYNAFATMVQATFRGYHSRKINFDYRSYRNWLRDVTARSDRLVDQLNEYRDRSKVDNIAILEEECRQWLAFVVYKLHHLLRTVNCAGIYSKPASTELSEFEQLIKMIRYTEYINRLHQLYDEFVRKHKPKYNRKMLFPIIGDGYDYWYLSLPEMYDLIAPVEKKVDTRHLALHHSRHHKKPFLYRKVRPVDDIRGPFISKVPPKPCKCPSAPKTSLVDKYCGCRDDPRFHLYVKHYKPNPDLMEYVDYHINVVLSKKFHVVSSQCMNEPLNKVKKNSKC